MKNPIVKYAFVDAILTALYIVLIALFLAFMPKNLLEEGPKLFAPILMLSLLVFSASITGSLVLGRPILWYLDGKKKEAVQLFVYTLACFFFMTCFFFVVMVGKSLIF
jgi:hypothetical protein